MEWYQEYGNKQIGEIFQQFLKESIDYEDIKLIFQRENTLDYFWQQILQNILKKIKKDSQFQKIQKKSEGNSKKTFENKIFRSDFEGELYQYFFSHHLELKNNKCVIIQNTKKSRQPGRVYTPFEIISFIISLIKKELKERRSNIITNQIIADIACGTGRFLTEWKESSINSNNNEIYEYYGYDTDVDALNIAQRFSDSIFHWEHLDSLLDTRLDVQNIFDIILGNPPYIESRMIPDTTWNNLKNKYKTPHKKFDLSVIFLEKTIELLKPGGLAGYIITNKWMVSDYGEKLRKMILEETNLLYLIDISHYSIFQSISTYPIIIIFRKRISSQKPEDTKKTKIFVPNELNDFEEIITSNPKNIKNMIEISQHYFSELPKSIITTNITPESFQVIHHFQKIIQEYIFQLGDLNSPYELRKGIHTGNVKEKLIVEKCDPDMKNFHKIISSRHKIEAFRINWENLWVNYDPQLIQRDKGDYGALREEWIFQAHPKLIIKLFGKKIQAAIDHYGYYTNNSTILVVLKQNQSKSHNQYHKIFVNIEQEYAYLAGIMNSYLVSYYYRQIFGHTHVRGNFLQYYIKDLNQIPLIVPTTENRKYFLSIANLSQKIEKYYKQQKSGQITQKYQETILMKLKIQLEQDVMKLYQIPKELAEKIIKISSKFD